LPGTTRRETHNNVSRTRQQEARARLVEKRGYRPASGFSTTVRLAHYKRYVTCEGGAERVAAGAKVRENR
jgi:hypothetical protein